MVGMLVGKWITTTVYLRPDKGDSSSNYPREDGGEKSNGFARRSLAALMSSAALVVALAELFLPYKWNNSHLPTKLLGATYAALFRFGWSLVLAYVVVSCRHRRGESCSGATGNKWKHDALCNCFEAAEANKLDKTNNISLGKKHDICWHEHVQQQHSKPQQQQRPAEMCFCGSGGNLVNRFLGLDVFANLNKLSFVAYLIHLPVMSVFIGQTRGLFAFSHTLVMHLALSYLVLTVILSFVLVHIIEFPFITFEKYLFEKLFYEHSDKDKRCDESLCRVDTGSGRKFPTGASKLSTIIQSSGASSFGLRQVAAPATMAQPQTNTHNNNNNKQLSLEQGDNSKL